MFNDIDCQALQAALRRNPNRVRCPLDGSSVVIRQCSAFSPVNGYAISQAFRGAPPKGWTITRAKLVCRKCGGVAVFSNAAA